MNHSLLHKSWFYELVILILGLSLWNGPIPGRTLTTESFSTATYHVNLAMGLSYTGVYPNYSPEAKLRLSGLPLDHPNDFLTVDLKSLLPATLWDSRAAVPYPHVGLEPGMVFAIAKLWHYSGVYTLGIIVSALKFLQVISVLALFWLLARLGLPGLALTGALLFAYSPAMAASVDNFSVYALSPMVTVIATLLVVLSIQSPKTKIALAFSALRISLATLVLGLAALARSTILYQALPFATMLVFSLYRQRRGRDFLVYGLVAIATWMSLQGVLQQQLWKQVHLGARLSRHHEIWHPIWCGLGEFSNPYGFVWRDDAAEAYAQQVDPQIATKSFADYEAILKQRVMHVLTHDPGWFLEVLCKRVYHLITHWLDFIPGLSLAPSWVALLLWVLTMLGLWRAVNRHRPRTWLFIALPSLFEIFIPLLIYSSATFYNLNAYLGFSLLFISVIWVNVV